ncbi:MAG: imidazole glycerol phosphate synthase subunit HisF [Candidatus Marinimicrobia bacterium]|nr:imidazole glycerol phosphate synthase subunit HisF [Candidatus Neomarinimicrobiota bacterium]
MLKKRIIPCLDIKKGRIVKGVHFINLQDAGDPVELAQAYSEQGADELVFLDITATVEKRKTLVDLVQKVARAINIPFTVGGGISSVEDVGILLDSGADKISINTAAVNNPNLINALANRFGSQCVVLAVDTKQCNGSDIVFIDGGRTPTKKKTFEWMKDGTERGAGEILLTSMDHDGTKNGFAIELTRKASEIVNVPIIASGGAGKMEHFAHVFTEGKADAALAASVFHYGEIKISELKKYLSKQNIEVRL